MAEYRHREDRGASRLRFAALALALTSSHAYADTFQEKWMGRIARPPADDQEASVYWEDKWDARGKRFKANEVSCAHRTEAFGTIFVVTNLENGKKIRCPVQDRGPFARGRVLDFSLGAARQIGCDRLVPRHRTRRGAGCTGTSNGRRVAHSTWRNRVPADPSTAAPQ